MKRMTGDMRGWAKGECTGRLDNEGRERERETTEREGGVTGDCCSGSDRKWKADRRKDEEVH